MMETRATAKHLGGIAASTPEALADALLKAAESERGHVSADELAEVCRLVLRKLRGQCPCGLGAEPWHISGVCKIGRAKSRCLGCDSEKGQCDYWKRQGRAACCPDCKHPERRDEASGAAG